MKHAHGEESEQNRRSKRHPMAKKHTDDKRANIPTAELQSVMRDDERRLKNKPVPFSPLASAATSG